MPIKSITTIWFGLWSLIWLLPGQAAQVLSHVVPNQAPTPAQIQAFCHKYATANNKYKKAYLQQYRQYCPNQAPVSSNSIPANTSPVSSTAVLQPIARFSQLWLPKCLAKGSQIRVTGQNLKLGQVRCNMQPKLGLHLNAPTASELRYQVTGTPRQNAAYQLRCHAGSQSLTSKQVYTCTQPPAATAVESQTTPGNTQLPDLAGSLSLLAPIQTTGGQQQGLKINYRNLGQGRSNKSFALLITLSRAADKKNTGFRFGRVNLAQQTLAGKTVPAPGSSQMVFASIRIPDKLVSGTYNWCVRLDDQTAIDESNETNNGFCLRQHLDGSQNQTRQLTGIFGAKLRNQKIGLGLDKPDTRPDGKSLLRKQLDPSTLHVLDLEPARVHSGVAQTINSAISPDLVVSNIRMNPARNGIRINWASLNDLPLPAGQFSWQVDFYEVDPHQLTTVEEDTSPGSLNSRPANVVHGVTVVHEAATSGLIGASFPAELRGTFVKVEVRINTGTGADHYPEGSTRNNRLIRHLNRSGEISNDRPSEILAIRGYPAHGSEHIQVDYSLNGSRSGRIGILANETFVSEIISNTLFTSTPNYLHCYPDAGDGFSTVRAGLNQTTEFVCPLPLAASGEETKRGNVQAILLRPNGTQADYKHTYFDFYHPLSQPGIDDHRKADLTVRIIHAQRHNGLPPVIVLEVSNQGGVDAPATDLYVNVSPDQDGVCHWPNHHRETLAPLAAGQHRLVNVLGPSCRSWTPNTLRTSAAQENPQVMAVVDPDSRLPELNENNNMAISTLGDSVDNRILDPTIRIDRVIVLTSPIHNDGCLESGTVNIMGGPFPSGIQLALDAGSEANNRFYAQRIHEISSLGPHLHHLATNRLHLATNRLQITMSKCFLNRTWSGHTLKLQLHYPNHGRSRWLTISQ